MKNALKELVKKHFNLVDAPEVEETVVEEQLSEEVVETASEEVVEETLSEETTEETFGEITTADGELTLSYPGEELTAGIEIFVVTEDGNIPAPDGEHALAGDITIETEGGVITEVSATEVEAESEEEMSEEVEATEEEFEGESSDVNINELHEALIQMIGGEFKEQFTALKEELMGEINTVKEQFNAAPATEKTITNKKSTYGRETSTDISYNPADAKKKAQFERLLKLRKKN
jgi:hypothetical protein